jgi:hypothetical protein
MEHPGTGVVQFEKNVRDDVLGIDGGEDDVFHEIGQWANHAVVDFAEGFLVPFAKGQDNRPIVIVVDWLRYFRCFLHDRL